MITIHLLTALTLFLAFIAFITGIVMISISLIVIYFIITGRMAVAMFNGNESNPILAKFLITAICLCVLKTGFDVTLLNYHFFEDYFLGNAEDTSLEQRENHEKDKTK